MAFLYGNLDSAKLNKTRQRWRPRAFRCRRSSVHMKVKRLQRLIPGGRDLQPDRLFLKTADYILHLKLQIRLLQAISNIYVPSN